MSFDSLTIFGILASMLSGGFVFAMGSRGDSATQRTQGFAPESEDEKTVRQRS